MNRSQAARHTTRATRPQTEPSPRRPAGKKHNVRPPRPTDRPRPTQRVRRGWAGRAGRRRGTEGQGGENEKRGPNPPPPTCTHPTAARRATAGHQQGPPWSQTGPPERGCVPAPAQQHARARSARHTQAKQGTHAAPHASTHHGTKTRHHHGKHPHPTTNEPPRTSPSPAVPTARQPPSGWTCVRPAVNPAPAGYEPAAVRMDVCAPGSEPSPCRLRNSRRPDGRVCARQ